jgi:hypothetical protein
MAYREEKCEPCEEVEITLKQRIAELERRVQKQEQYIENLLWRVARVDGEDVPKAI